MKIKKVIFCLICCSAILSCQTAGKVQKYKSAITKPTISSNTDQNKKNQAKKNRADQSKSKDATFVYSPAVPIEKNKTAKSSSKNLTPGHLSLELDEVRIGQAIKIILGDLLKQTYVLPPNIKGRVTLKTARPLTKEQMYAMLQSVLKLNNLSLRMSGDLLEIIPIPMIGNSVKQFTRAQDLRGHVIEAIPLRHISVKQMTKLITPLISNTMSIPPSNANDVILIAGTAEDRKTARKAITFLDIDQMARQHIGLFKLKNSAPKEVISELKQIFHPNGGSIVSFTGIKRLNAILAIAPSENYIQRAKTWVKRLDKTINADQRRLFVYFVKHGVAGDLVKTLKGVFAGNPNKQNSVNQNTNQSSDSISTNEDILSNELPRFNSDKKSNSILIWATGKEYELISEVLIKLDMMPSQVLIEGTVLEVTLKNDLRYGLKYLIEAGEFQSIFTREGANVSSTLPGFSASIGGPNSTKVIIDALSELTDVRVVSSPQLLVMDGGTARLHVGDQVPIVKRSSATTAADNDRIINEIEYRNTGVTLDVTPTVKASGIVNLKISQAVSDVITTSSSNIDSPTIQQRQVTSSASLPSGTSVVLAGLIREVTNDSSSGLPLLHNLPGLGFLFGVKGDSSQRTELLIIITPKIIKRKSELELNTHKILKKYKNLFDLREMN